MKKSISAILLIIIVSACNSSGNRLSIRDSLDYDSMSLAQTGKTVRERAIEKTDSIVQSSIKESLLDTVGLYKSPVKILKYKVIKEEYSNYRSVYLAYKNNSKKDISAIKFMWYGVNAFGDPADLGNSMAPGFGNGFTDDELKSNHISYGTWNVLSRDAKKIELAWPYEVSFTDGTHWKL